MARHTDLMVVTSSAVKEDCKFSCGDGACVSADIVCDGATHCTNGGDELGYEIGLPQTGTCTLPKYPAHGSYVTDKPNAGPGDAYNSVIISITCQDGFLVDGSTSLTSCFNGFWSNEMPKCVLQCHLPPHPSVDYSCIVSGTGGSRSCKEYEPSGTVVYPPCRSPIYYSPTTLPYMRCTSGRWSYIARCIPDCGTVTSSGDPQIAGGVPASHGEVPWHAGIYSKVDLYRQICGGSLISNAVVLSAAHCFWTNSLDGGAKQPADSFAVAVGKLHRAWHDSTDEAQTSDVKDIHVPARFLGSAGNFQNDIAVLIVTKPFEYKSFVRPVCVDFDDLFEKRQLQPGKKGKVAGWGLTKNGTMSQVLQVIDLPYIDIEKCTSESPPTFLGHITGDKICAGFKDEGKAVCKGDSGGGLAFAGSDKGTTRYYLRGIASSAPVSGDSCNVNFYTTFTEIQIHKQFIMEYWVAADISSDDNADGDKMQQNKECILPPFPENGYYFVTNAPDAKPGDSLEFATINISCDKGYKVNGSSYGHCVTGMWRGQIPTCVDVSCGKLPFFPHGSAELLNGTTNLGSVVQYSCATNYQLVGPARRTCAEDFQWSESAPTCEVDCGIVTPLTYGSADLLNGTTHLNSVVQYSCATNYKLVGPARRTCTEDFQWSETAPTCEVDCGIVTPLTYGSADLLNGTTHLGSVVQYSCTTNYRLVGPAQRTCTEDFQWSETAPTCEVLPCKEESPDGYTPYYSLDDVSLLHYGTQRRDSTGHRVYWELNFAARADGDVGILLTEKVDYWLNIRYYLFFGEDSHQRTRLSYNGDKVHNIHTPDILSSTQFRSFYIKIDDGKLQFGKEGDPPLISYGGDVGSLKYYRFYSYRATKLRFCPAPVQVDCGNVTPLTYGSADLLNGTTHLNSVVQYSCATNYKLVGPARRTCTEDFQWTETAPTCEVDCGIVTPLTYGSVDLLNGTTHLGSVVQYSCATNYRLVGPARRTCTEDFQWSETAPTCEVLPCKEETPDGYTPHYSLDDVSLLHYGTQRRDSTGHRAYWELDFAVRADGHVGINLSEKEEYWSDIHYGLYVGVDSPQRTRLYYNGAQVRDIPTPDILSSTQFQSFYIKIDDGKLQFGKEGDPPLISYGINVSSLNYYRFWTFYAPAKIRFCPAPVEGSP